MALYLVQLIAFFKSQLTALWDFTPTQSRWALFFFFAAIFGSIHLIIRHEIKRPRHQALFHGKGFVFIKDLFKALQAPFEFLIGTIALAMLVLSVFDGNQRLEFLGWVDTILNVVGFGTLFWFLFRVIRFAVHRFQTLSIPRDSKWEQALFPLVANALYGTLIVIGFNVCLQLFHFSSRFASIFSIVGSMLMIGIIAWFLIKATLSLDVLAQMRFDINEKDNLQARKVHTQVHVIQRVLIFFIGLISVGCALMLFDDVRKFGTTLLASAGLAGIVLGFAAQQTIANLLAGLQIAATQPIRLDDVVVVENEWGRIEEISLTYVVVRLWDLRRLVVPISYFTTKPFQNWTRSSSEILGTVFLYVDYSVPLEIIRNEAERIVKESPLWNGKNFSVIISDTTEKAMKVRVLIGARNSGDSFDLRCLLREKLIEFLRQNHPNATPQVRLAPFKGNA